MAVGTIIPATGFKILVATAAAPTTFVPLSFMNTYETSVDEDVAEFDVFDFATAIAFSGREKRTLTASGYLAEADDGQDMCFAAAQAKTGVIIKGLWDGTTNGFTVPCIVRAYRGGARAGNQPADVSFDFTATGAPTVVGTGPLL